MSVQEPPPIIKRSVFTLELTEDEKGFGIWVRDADGNVHVSFAKTAGRALLDAYPFILARSRSTQGEG